MNFLTTLYRHRLSVVALVKREIMVRYAGSYLGIGWLALYPLAFLAIYSVVYMRIFKLQMGQIAPADYLLLIYCGLIPFMALAETMANSTSSIVANKDVVQGTLFPIELLPVRYAGASIAILVVGFSILLVWSWSLGHIYWTQLFLPIAIVIQLVFMIGVAWLFSTIYVFYRDFGQFVGLLTLVLMLLSPISFDRSTLPPELAAISAFNPLFPIMELYRSLILRGNVSWLDLGLACAVSIGSFAIGAAVFGRAKAAFGEYL
jgi:lipopolysaccharide transport system permease protein